MKLYSELLNALQVNAKYLDTNYNLHVRNPPWVYRAQTRNSRQCDFQSHQKSTTHCMLQGYTDVRPYGFPSRKVLLSYSNIRLHEPSLLATRLLAQFLATILESVPLTFLPLLAVQAYKVTSHFQLAQAWQECQVAPVTSAHLSLPHISSNRKVLLWALLVPYTYYPDTPGFYLSLPYRLQKWPISSSLSLI